MQYYLCPRCQFKIAQNKHVCQTCGLNMSTYANSAANGQDSESSQPVVKNVWAKFLGLTGRSKESTQEKPALS